jgi:hypothetical protein
VSAEQNIYGDLNDRLKPVDQLQLRSARQPVLLRELASNIDAFNGSDIADVSHYLCLLHGRYPGLMDNLADRMVGTGDIFYADLAERYTAERRLLTDMTVAAGPINRLSGEDRSMNAVEQLRVAIDLLARSDREGCALGAAAALLIEWKHIRPALNAMARRLGVKTGDFDCDGLSEQMIERVTSYPDQRHQRAIGFGVKQLCHQHEQFWLLLNNRCAARRAAVSI